ncbi:TRAP-type transporter, small permease component [Cupriavidus taiwanensis]|uniref:TRAP transporter small permease protein n=1 Tax=Cupriavidus taiwanensis TaxID=164546 RepID=A0A976G1Y8_9BURK|nr:TRAP transporter small permease subunit [Cupriavidus taiwanensis]SOZ13938.1 TRAP-type transporter, small permease component [Cupriavidus taiwanensis]SOZ25301.1 TRAP-type transporter, small permease component [Cupriavidus taiwanensis]SOZ44552.1 TRAP-type transporter, small permease component [Cupriavidus taiwanensis]SOZ55469.1 TRAP-type transporter, small permease component [Cupriavidus taiwanensis]SOZ56945.1 TRAP-type transporter, small permease component [Cupriavidus taiwanensis]
MSSLMRISRLIDAVNAFIGQWAKWLVLLAVLVCAGNAIIRYTFSVSSNAWLELQWYMFAGVFLLGAPYTLRRDEHVRIDVIAGRFSERTQVWIDIFGILFFLLPISLIILWLSIPYFWLSYAGHEMSGNAGGLIRWPAKFLIVAGFALMILQGLSELIKRFAYLKGDLPFSAFRKHAVDPALEIAAIAQANQTAASEKR